METELNVVLRNSRISSMNRFVKLGLDDAPKNMVLANVINLPGKKL